LERYEFLQWFNGIVVSGHEGMAKPDVEIFKLLLDRFGLTASRTLFIDDTLVNVKAAHSLGLQVLHFLSAEGLREELAARHLVAPTVDLESAIA
jgi:2-haloacid dehalogenase